MREVVKEGDVVTNKIIGVASRNHQDVYGAECKM
jgi:branched-chain amino acid transport system substrate-binding protein